MARLEQHQKVFGLGLSRTGTTSLGNALNILGITTIHFPCDQATYDELRKGIYKLSVLEKFQGVVDIPLAPYYAQLDKVYPGSKFIFTFREIGSWLKSVEIHWRYPWATGVYKEFTDFIYACVYGTIEFNEDRFRYVYETHFRNVCEYFAHRPSDLLVMDISDGDGWEKLCPFLGFPIPDSQFPNLNIGENSQKWRQNLNLAIQEISSIIPPGTEFILVDDAKLGWFGEDTAGRRAIPFLEKEGVYWGAPPNDMTAIQELERLRKTGVIFMAFGFPAFWWLDYYTDLNHHLRSNFRCVLENDRLVVFHLQS
jgi:SAM-dependent methyltransferase